LAEDKQVYDITIIGGGPSGLFGAFYAGMRQMSVKIVEALHQLGGQLTALYPEKFIYDMPGFPKVRASELVQRLVEQAMQFNPKICLGETAMKLEKLDEKTLPLNDGQKRSLFSDHLDLRGHRRFLTEETGQARS
jgi:ferredoxin/flavodoxin---NADP+ reductase